MKKFLICIIFSLCVQSQAKKINEEEIYKHFALIGHHQVLLFHYLNPNYMIMVDMLELKCDIGLFIQGMIQV